MVVLHLIRPFKFNFTIFYIANPRRKKFNLGSVKFTENNICVNHRRNTIHYAVSELEYLEIKGGLYWDYNPLRHMLAGDNLPRRKHTGKTRFILKFSDKSISINFQITTQSEFNELTKMIAAWYESKDFKIREYHLGIERMLLLDPYRTYEQIQEVKKEIGIESMYE